VCGSFWRVDKIQNDVTMETEIPKAYLIRLDVDVTGIITAKLCEVGSEFKNFCTLVTISTAAKK
jgi:hypothetical protein